MTARHQQQFSPARFEPLRVTARLADPVVVYEGLHLDSILAHAVVEADTLGMFVGDYRVIPLPLEQAWRTDSGVPLWCSTDLLPKGHTVQGVAYFHRRALAPTMTRRNLQTAKGRHKELRSPLPVLRTDSLSSDVVGDAEAIAELLRRVSSIGKKRTSLGRVVEWNIESIAAFEFFDDERRARRPVPVAYCGVESDSAVEIGFSPPYWHRATRALCIPTGAR